jgi:fucose permease
MYYAIVLLIDWFVIIFHNERWLPQTTAHSWVSTLWIVIMRGRTWWIQVHDTHWVWHFLNSLEIILFLQYLTWSFFLPFHVIRLYDNRFVSLFESKRFVFICAIFNASCFELGLCLLSCYPPPWPLCLWPSHATVFPRCWY